MAIRRRKQPPKLTAALALALMLLAAALVLLRMPADGPEQPEPAALPEDGFEIWFLDVGQADSSLIVCGGETMLIDGGNVDDASYVVASLEQYGVTALDYVVNTHCDEDHVGGLAGVLAKYPAAHVWSSTTEYGTKAFSNFVKYAEQQGREIEIPSAGDAFTLGSADVTVLGPLRDYENNNENSIVLRIDYGETSFLFTGDMGITAEDELVESGARLDATVLKVGHHGSAGSTGYVFLREVMPQYAVISVGADNSYGHPTEAALSRLRDADVQVFRTDLQGVVHLTSDGKTVTFDTERSAAEAQLNPTIKDAAETYVGNRNSQIFHVSTCHSCPAEKNAVYFDSVWDALDAGYRAHSCVN